MVVNGENSSISISKTQVTTLSVEQENSLIQLEETKISKTFVSKDCKLDSVSGDTSFGSVYVQKTVEKIELAGSAKIEKKDKIAIRENKRDKIFLWNWIYSGICTFSLSC